MAMLEIVESDDVISIKKECVYSVELFFNDEWEIRIGYGLDDNCFVRCGKTHKEYAEKIYHQILQSLKIEHDDTINIERPAGE